MVLSGAAAGSDGYSQTTSLPWTLQSSSGVTTTLESSSGSRSTTSTENASDGPLLVTVIVYCMSSPATAEVSAVLTTSRSASATVFVSSVSLLSLGRGSGVVERTRAVFSNPAAPIAGSTVPVNSSTTTWSGCKVPRSQLTCWTATTHGAVTVNGPSSWGGSVSSTTTLRATDGPPLVTVTV